MTSGKPETLVGQIVDGYRILEIAGSGGMGVVFKAVNLGLAKTVALKMIDPSLASNEKFQQSFQSEARALARTDTSNIVRVYDLRRNEHGLFIVMEFVEGNTVADAIESRGGRLPWQESLPIIKQALAALDHAHGVGVVHRDVKPQNLMLQESGTVKVTDFGLAKVERTDSESTVLAGEWEGGTIPYMAPEQVRGRDVDHRADIYALGMMFYEILTGHRPFVKDDRFSSLEAMVRDQPPSPLQFTPDLPQSLVEIVLKAIEKKPERRFQTAGQMLDALEAFESAVGDDVIRAEGRRRGRRLPLAITIVVIAAIGIAYLAVRNGSSGPPVLTVTTDPAGAYVRLDGHLLGRTPLEGEKVDEGLVGRSPLPLRIELEGYRAIDTLIAPAEGSHVELNLTLVAESDQTRMGELRVTSDPPDATVYVDGKELGRTPITIHLDKKVVAVRIEKQGYKTWMSEAVLNGRGQTTEMRAELQSTQPTPTTARLTLRADPDGTVAWRGTTGQASRTYTVPAGTHTVTFTRGTATRDTTIRVNAGANKALTCFFEHEIRVNSRLDGGDQDFVSGSVTVNGEIIGETPALLRYGPGVYKIGVSRFGYETLDPERTIVIRPAFELKSYPVVVTLRRE